MFNYLKCDAEGCDHQEQIEGLTEDMIGRPCPKCGASLLTEEDYRHAAPLQAGLKAVSALIEKLNALHPGEPKEMVSISTNVRASATTITVKPEPK